MSMLRSYLYRMSINSQRVLRNRLRCKRKLLRESTDPFSIAEERFIEIFRLPKQICRNVFEEVCPFMLQRNNSFGLSKILRFLVALRFFAQGSYQRSVGQDLLLNISQSSASRCIREIASIMDRYLLTRYVKFPTTTEEKQAVKEKFYQKYRFPGIIGAIDGSHIKIKSPSKDIEHVYVCRKGGHSVNVQVVCDMDLRILDCNARFGGTAHDASVWRASALKVFLDNKYSNGERNQWLLGDSGYPQLPYLMTPIAGNNLSPAEDNYNRHHRKARNCVERCFGVLKTRFRCLSKERVLMYDPVVAGKIINSCIILHNIMILNNVMYGIDDNDSISSDELLDNDDEVTSTHQGNSARQQIVNTYFNF